mgnify:CR=1 FL=1
MSRVSSDLFSPLPEPAGDMFGPAGASRRLLGIVALIAAVVVVFLTAMSGRRPKPKERPAS